MQEERGPRKYKKTTSRTINCSIESSTQDSLNKKSSQSISSDSLNVYSSRNQSISSLLLSHANSNSLSYDGSLKRYKHLHSGKYYPESNETCTEGHLSRRKHCQDNSTSVSCKSISNTDQLYPEGVKDKHESSNDSLSKIRQSNDRKICDVAVSISESASTNDADNSTRDADRCKDLSFVSPVTTTAATSFHASTLTPFASSINASAISGNPFYMLPPWLSSVGASSASSSSSSSSHLTAASSPLSAFDYPYSFLAAAAYYQHQRIQLANRDTLTSSSKLLDEFHYKNWFNQHLLSNQINQSHSSSSSSCSQPLSFHSRKPNSAANVFSSLLPFNGSSVLNLCHSKVSDCANTVDEITTSSHIGERKESNLTRKCVNSPSDSLNERINSTNENTRNFSTNKINNDSHVMLNRDTIGELLMSHQVPLINYSSPTVTTSNASVTSSSTSRAALTLDCRLLSAAKSHALYLQQRQQQSQRVSSVAAFNIASLAHQFKYPSCTNDTTTVDASSSNSSCLWWLSLSHQFIFHQVTNVSSNFFPSLSLSLLIIYTFSSLVLILSFNF